MRRRVKERILAASRLSPRIVACNCFDSAWREVSAPVQLAVVYIP